MANDSRLLDWYTYLEDKCFVNQLHQAVSITLSLYSILWNCEINFISLDAGHLYGLLLQGLL